MSGEEQGNGRKLLPAIEADDACQRMARLGEVAACRKHQDDCLCAKTHCLWIFQNDQRACCVPVSELAAAAGASVALPKGPLAPSA